MPDDQILIEHQNPGESTPCIACGTALDISGFRPLDDIECPDCGAAQAVPAVLGRYRLVKRLGEGAMGRVYLGEDRDLRRKVAVKILREDFDSTPKMWTLLEREAKAAANISHNNVVSVFDFGKIRGRPYIVMEMVESGSLEDRLRDQGPIVESEAIQIAIDVMNGLRAANRVELLHGDIKPANIILTPEGHAKVADFGLARFHEDRTVVERWGTPYYIAPEKSRQIQEDFRSDLYALGATLFHLVSGYPPFIGDTAEEVIEKSLRKKTPKLRHRFPDCSPGFSEIVHTMMQREPDDRFWSYDKPIACLTQLREGRYRLGTAAKHGPADSSIWNRAARGFSSLFHS